MDSTHRIQLLIKALTANIFQHEERRLEHQATALAIEACGYDSKLDGVYFQGRLFSKLALNLQSRGVNGNPHPNMISALQAFIIDERNTQSERGRVSQALTLILRGCKTDQDIFDALPDSLHAAFFENSSAVAEHMTRCQSEAWTVEGNPRAMAQYQKLVDFIIFYNTAKLLY